MEIYTLLAPLLQVLLLLSSFFAAVVSYILLNARFGYKTGRRKDKILSSFQLK